MIERGEPRLLALYDSAAVLRLVEEAIKELAGPPARDPGARPAAGLAIEQHLNEIRERAASLGGVAAYDGRARNIIEPHVLAQAADKLREVRDLLTDASSPDARVQGC
ncbi:MAG: hypothetical protein ACT4OZ_15610 [Gemmatimonadota bacterium]